MPEFLIVPTSEKVTRQVLSDHPDFMVVAFSFAAEGAVGALHDHLHVQSTYDESGRFGAVRQNHLRRVALVCNLAQ